MEKTLLLFIGKLVAELLRMVVFAAFIGAAVWTALVLLPEPKSAPEETTFTTRSGALASQGEDPVLADQVPELFEIPLWDGGDKRGK